MTELTNPTPRPNRTPLAQALDRPAPLIWRLFGIVVGSVLFFGIMGILGGPVEGDASESVYSTWAVAHGHFACMYPVVGHSHLNELANLYALVAPVYVLLSGAIAAVLRIGHTVPFPSAAALGPNCHHAVHAIYHWSVISSAILTTVRICYVTWPLLVLGALWLVRTSGRRGTWWEPASVVTLAFVTPMWMCLVEYFHPQDVFAMSVVLLATAAAVKGRWGWCGVAAGVAVATQQFALLPAALLLVVAGRGDRRPYLLGALGATAVIDVPLVLATSGRALRVILTGSSRAGSHISSTGGTVLWELHLHGAPLFVVARLLPVVAALGIGWWGSRRFGSAALEPATLAGLVGLALACRLVLEENLFGYYFMAVGVSLVVIDALRGRFDGRTWAWIGLVTLAWNPVNPGFYSNWTTWGPQLNLDLPIGLFTLGVLAVAIDAIHRRVSVYKLAWLLIALLTSESRLWGSYTTILRVPHWGWQLILVPTALVLLAQPLLDTARSDLDVKADAATLAGT